MRSIRKHEYAPEGALCGIVRAMLECSRSLGEWIPAEGKLTVTFDDSIIANTAAEKA